MKIAFVDPSGWGYTLDAPLNKPMGGTESAICYLATELGNLGHEVTVYNGKQVPSDALNASDVAIVASRPLGRVMRENIKIPLVLWQQQSFDQPSVLDLGWPAERECWTGFVYVSEWQRTRFESIYGILPEKGVVLRNAAAPPFLNKPVQTDFNELVLFYTSTPFRGLDVLLKAFPAIRKETGAKLQVYSSMAVYQVKAENDSAQNQALYDACRSMDGVEYIGSCGQNELAERLQGATAMAYPCTFAETSCIAAIEAMGLGALVFGTKLGALPETCGVFFAPTGWLFDRSALAESFAKDVVNELQWMQENPEDAAASRWQRHHYIRNNYNWKSRALEWEEFLMGLLGSKAKAAA